MAKQKNKVAPKKDLDKSKEETDDDFSVGKEEDIGKEDIGKSEEDFFPKTDETGEEGLDTSDDLEDNTASKEEDGQQEDNTDEDDTEGDDTEGLELGKELSVDDFDLDFETDGEDKKEKKSGFQKRIDQLIAEKKSLEERLEKAEKSNSKETPEYSEAQLRQAMQKAIDEGDAALMWDIMDYRVKQEKDNVLNAERKKQEERIQQQQRVAKEWQSTVEEYEYLSDEEEPEIYRGSHRDLNLKDRNSLLVKLASRLYNDPNRSGRYNKEGGQRLAVSDAIKSILRKKKTKMTSKETDKLKRKLAKEKSKSSVSSGQSLKKTDKKPSSSGDNLLDYINERKSYQNKRKGGF